MRQQIFEEALKEIMLLAGSPDQVSPVHTLTQIWDVANAAMRVPQTRVPVALPFQDYMNDADLGPRPVVGVVFEVGKGASYNFNQEMKKFDLEWDQSKGEQQ